MSARSWPRRKHFGPLADRNGRLRRSCAWALMCSCVIVCDSTYVAGPLPDDFGRELEAAGVCRRVGEPVCSDRADGARARDQEGERRVVRSRPRGYRNHARIPRGYRRGGVHRNARDAAGGVVRAGVVRCVFASSCVQPAEGAHLMRRCGQERGCDARALLNANLLRALEAREGPRALQRQRVEEVQLLRVGQVWTIDGVVLGTTREAVRVDAVNQTLGFPVLDADAGDVQHADPEHDEEKQEEKVLASPGLALKPILHQRRRRRCGGNAARFRRNLRSSHDAHRRSRRRTWRWMDALDSVALSVRHTRGVATTHTRASVALSSRSRLYSSRR